jgi:hypothetical protein
MVKHPFTTTTRCIIAINAARFISGTVWVGILIIGVTYAGG